MVASVTTAPAVSLAVPCMAARNCARASAAKPRRKSAQAAARRRAESFCLIERPPCVRCLVAPGGAPASANPFEDGRARAKDVFGHGGRLGRPDSNGGGRGRDASEPSGEFGFECVCCQMKK